MKRRTFLKVTTLVTGATLAGQNPSLLGAPPRPTAARLPRWRGFNLMQKFVARKEGNPPYPESDFSLIAEWGFDFVRLPLSYHCWATPEEPLKLREAELKHLDDAVKFGTRHGVHVNLNLHRAPGYCVNPPAEPLNLWRDEKALEACAFHWAHFTKRFQGIANDQLSFDLVNEPANVSEADYTRVVRGLVQAIRTEDPQRLIIADGLNWGRDPVHSLADLGIGQSTRGYDPMEISHHRASWIKGSDQWPEPTWPLKTKDGRGFDKASLQRDRIKPWQELESKGVGIHIGEWGAHNRTPHAVALAWMKDCLELWKTAGWGWALWNLRGSFGVLDSNRPDVNYEDFHGGKLDREMLKVLQAG